MSQYRRLAIHTSHYMMSQILGMIAGLISVPILTRILAKEDYGRLSLILLGVQFFVAFVRLGIPQSITRHLPEYSEKGQESNYISSVFLFSLTASFAISVVVAGIGSLLRYTRWEGWSIYVLLFGVLLANETLISTISEVFRAQQRSLLTSTIGVFSRYLTLAASLLFFFLVSRSLFAFLAGKAAIQILMLVVFVAPLFRWGYVRIQKIDFGIIKQAMRYGLPLSIATAGGFFIAYGDRYAIQSLLNATEVARYSLPYDILQQLEAALTTPLRMAIVPMVFSMMLNDGLERASDFLSQIIHGVLLLIIPMIAGIAFFAKDIIILLGSRKYEDSSSLLPILAIGILFGGINFLFTTGLSFQKRTDIIAYMTLGSGILNILMNLVLIPFMGVFGSAWATLLTYGILLIISYRLSSRYLRIRFFPLSLVKSAAASLFMLAILLLIDAYTPGGGFGLILKIPAGALVYTSLIFLLDVNVRSYALRALHQTTSLLGRSA